MRAFAVVLLVGCTTNTNIYVVGQDGGDATDASSNDFAGAEDLATNSDLRTASADLTHQADFAGQLGDMTACGALNEPCCPGGVNEVCGGSASLVCIGMMCVACGQSNQPCCALPNQCSTAGGPPYLQCLSTNSTGQLHCCYTQASCN